VGIIGVIFFVLFSIVERVANGTKKELMSELENMGTKVSTCPNCQKQLPKGNFEFCPFCGTSLKPKSPYIPPPP
jgi:rRNA maturation endonuclease Nob1